MMTEAEKVEAVVEILFEAVSLGGRFRRGDADRFRDWMRSKVLGKAALIAAAEIPEEDTKRIQHEVYLYWRWKGNPNPTYENMPEDLWGVERHADLLCKALAAFARSRSQTERPSSCK